VATHLLLNLQLVDDGRQLGKDLVRLLVVLELCGDEVGEVAERLGGVEDLRSQQSHWGAKRGTHILHDADSLLRLSHKLVLGLLDLGPRLFG
jgi:hypothetical protein